MLQRTTIRLRTALIVAMCAVVIGLQPLAGTAQEASTPESAPPQPSIAFYPADENQPGYINVELKPGEEETVKLVLGNNGEVAFDAVTYAADAYTIRNGGFGLRDLDSEHTGPTTWLDYATETFATVPGQGAERELTIRVPNDVTPGEYVTGVAMQTADPVDAPAEGMFRLNQYYRSVIGIRILVPGELSAALQLGDPKFVIEGSLPAVVVPVINTGNLQLTPSGEIRIKDAEGGLVLSAPIKMGRVYGGHETELWLGLGQPLAEGEYQVSVELSDPEKDVRAELKLTAMLVEEDSADVETAISPMSITSSSASAMPNADAVQFLAVEATISNTGEPVANAQLSLIARLDGVEVERFPVVQSLSIPNGDTSVSTRYLPITGWTPGTWEFELLLEVVEASDAAVVVEVIPLEVDLTVGD